MSLISATRFLPLGPFTRSLPLAVTLLLSYVSLNGASLLVHEPTPGAPLGIAPMEGWLSVRQDHFHATNTEEFQLKYYHTPGNTTEFIMIMVGGQWEISPEWLQSGLMFELSGLLNNTATFYVEHRYYGSSRPTSDTSTPNLRYLTTDQVLGDLAQFIDHVRSEDFEDGMYSEAKVALFGCSYGGSLATWLRLGYPHLVHTVLSDSGPLLAQEDFPEYLNTVAEVIRTEGGEVCEETIASGMEEIQIMMNTAEGRTSLSELFNTCSPLSSSSLDLYTFLWYGLVETFSYFVQEANPGDVSAACGVFTQDENSNNTLEQLSQWINERRNNACLETRYAEIVRLHNDVEYTSPYTVSRLWQFQSCIQFGWFQSALPTNQSFAGVPLDYFHQQCADFFSDDVDTELLRSGIERTNLMFAGLSKLPDNVVAITGTADPWSAVLPQKAQERLPLTSVHIVQGISQCKIIRPLGDGDDPSIVQARRLASSQIMSLFSDIEIYPEDIDNGASAVSVTCMLAILLVAFTEVLR